jgi:hypothetical protein
MITVTVFCSGRPRVVIPDVRGAQIPEIQWRRKSEERIDGIK